MLIVQIKYITTNTLMKVNWNMNWKYHEIIYVYRMIVEDFLGNVTKLIKI